MYSPLTAIVLLMGLFFFVFPLDYLTFQQLFRYVERFEFAFVPYW